MNLGHWLKTMTPLGQRYSHANGGCQIPNAFVNVASNSPHPKFPTPVTSYNPRLCSISCIQTFSLC